MIQTQIVNFHKSYTIAYWKRHSESNKTIVFVHGFGSSKEHFRHAVSSPSLQDFTLIALDLVGFGQTKGPDEFGYSMHEQALIVLELLDQVGTKTFHLCGHSMGGLVAMDIAESNPQRVLSFIDLEGNLTIEDCSFTGKVAGSTFEEFAHTGRRKLEEEFRNAGTNDPSMNEYAESFSMASTTALYKSAYHTVQDSSAPLIEKFRRISNACYVYGDKNSGVFPGEKLLRAAGIPIFYIEHAGHAMAIDNPRHLYRVIGTFIDRLTPASS
jgi:pimeloyl-ACP methyl ester carboxylesterase